MRASMHWPLRHLMERQFAKADAIDLPDYPLAGTTGPTAVARAASPSAV